MTGFLRSIGFIADEPSTVRAATVEAPAAYRDATANEAAPSVSGSHSGDGSDAERLVQRLQARLSHLEMARDLTLTELIAAEAAVTKHKRVWDAS